MDSTIEGTTSADGKNTSAFTEVISKDGKVATFKTTAKGREGEHKQRVVHEKQ
jgi:hypothetical protein